MLVTYYVRRKVKSEMKHIVKQRLRRLVSPSPYAL